MLPALEPETAFFWTSGADGRLRILRCGDCGRYQHPPLPRCPSCHGESMAPAPVSGRGRVASFTVNVERWLPGLELPYVFAAVELEEQTELHVFTNVLGDPAGMRVGLPVRVMFEAREDIHLPLFVPEAGP